MRTRHDSKTPKTPLRSPALKSLTLALAVLAAFMTEMTPAQTINVNFNGGGDSPAESTLDGPAGGLGTTWNSVAAVDTGALNDSTGASTTVSIDTNYSNMSLGQQTSGTLPVFRSFADVFSRPNTNTVTINGLESGGIYDIWILSYRDISTFNTTERNVGTWTTSNTTTSPSSQSVNSQTGSPDGTTFQEGYNYVRFENVEATVGGVISFTATGNGAGLPQDGNSRRVHLNGLQIQNASPVIAGPVDDSMSTVTATPTAVIANGVSASTVKVALRDSNGVRVPNKEVTLANTGGLTPPNALTTNAQGEAGFAVSSSTPGTVVFSATVVADNLTLTDTASVEFTDPEAPVAFNVNFHAGTPATGLLGVVGDPGETWNQGTTSASNLTDATGTVASSVNVTGLPDGQETVNAALNVFDANRNFFGKGADTTISITGLVPDTAYDLYIYALSHNQASWGNSTDSERAAGDFITSNTVLGNGQSQWLDNGKAGTNGSNFVANGNYIVFQSIVSNGAGNISILADAYDGLNGISGDGDGDCRLHINGLQIRPASGMSVDYMNWRSASYPGLGLPDEDDDSDGLSNDFEYIFGLNPTSGASASPYPETLGLGNGFFRYTRRARSLIHMDYKVWYSTDLENWFEDNAANQMVESASNGVEVVGVDIDPELLGENKLFLQIRTTPITGLDPDPTLINLWGGGNTITLLFSKPMNPSSASNPGNYIITQDGVGTLPIANAVLSPDGGSVTLTLASALGTDTAYTVNLDRLTSATGQALGNNVTRQFRTWDDDPNGIKVFILAGQSNMVGYGNVETGATGAGTIGSLRYLAVNNGYYPQYDYTSLLTNPANTASAFRTRSDAKVWWRDGGADLGGTVRKGDLGPPFKGADNNLIGPEFAFGQVLGDFYADHDILVIKCAWGGRDLAEKFRPPSAVARVPGTQVGPFFSAIINDARDVLGNLGTQFPEWSGKGYQIVGFAWHQGFNDRINTAFSNEYKNNLPDLISDIRTVFNKPNLPFVIGSTGMDIGSPQAPPYPGYSAVEKAQLWVAGVSKPANVLSSDTRPFWRSAAVSPANQGYHWNWNAESYFLIGKTLGDDMVDLLTP
jgi:alpha-galactosidase